MREAVQAARARRVGAAARRGAPAPLLAGALLLLAAAALAADLVGPGRGSRAVAGIGLAAFAIGAALAAWLIGLARTRSQRAALGAAARRLSRVDEVVRLPALTTTPLDAGLGQVAATLREVLGWDYLAVLLTDPDGLRVRAAAGGPTARDDVGRTPSPEDPLVGPVLRQATTRTAEGSGAGGAVTGLGGGLAAAAAAAMRVGAEVSGVLLVGARAPRGFDDGEVALLEHAAERLASAVDTARLGESEWRARLGADHARRHLRLLGDASRTLMQVADDYELALVEVIDHALLDFAGCAVLLLADASPERGSGPGEASSGTGPAGRLRVVVSRCAGDADSPAELSGACVEPMRAVMASGRSTLAISTDPRSADDLSRPLAEMLAGQGVHSYVIAPIQVRGLSFGALLFGTGAGMRGYRPSDQGAIDELARRISLSIEAKLLYREARSNAAVASGHLQRLRSLLSVWLSVAAAAEQEAILAAAATGAAGLFGPARVMIASGDERHLAPDPARAVALSGAGVAALRRLDALTRCHDAAAAALEPADHTALGRYWLAAPIGRSEAAGGFIVVGSDRQEFSDEDESLLVLLTEMVGATLAKASLHSQTRANAARLSALFTASPAAIVSLTAELAPVGWNPAAAQLFDWPPSRTAGVSLPESVRDCVGALAGEVATGNRAQQADCTLTGARASARAGAGAGPERSLVLMLAPVRHDDGTVSGYIAVVTDDTDRRQLSAQLQQAQRLEAVGRLAGGVAHDFNNLLTVILGYTDGLLRRMDDDDPARNRVAAIHRAGTRGAELTRQLLTISRKQVVTPVVLRPAELIDQTHDMLGRITGERVTVIREPGGEELTVRIDKLQFEQVLLNLAANARDAMPDGGKLRLRVAAAGPPPDRAGDQGSWVSVSVSDTGTGMSPDTLAHCLEPLFTTKQPGEGTGLGLAVVSGIVSQSGGVLGVSSQPGRGATITLTLPMATGPAVNVEDGPLPGPRDQTELGTETVLLVEDDPEIRRMVWRLLRERGYRTLVADSAHEAVQILEGHSGPLDLVLTDVAMPDISGPELVGVMLGIRRVPVLFMSGYAEELAGRAATGSLQADFLPKPFTPEELFAKVRQALARG